MNIMNTERRAVQKPIVSRTLSMSSFVVFFTIYLILTGGNFTFTNILIFMVISVVFGLLTKRVDTYLYGAELILSAQGNETTGRIGAKITAWDDIIQVGATEQDMTKVLVLVKKGGKPMGEKTLEGWFIFRNPGKLIWLPDDKLTRAYVAKYYGPLDFDRLWKKEE